MIFHKGLPTRRLLGTMALALMLAGCASLRVGSDFDANAKFSGYRAFSWMPPHERHGTSNPLVAQRAHDAIQAELTRKGFRYVQDAAAADFVVDFTIGSHERVDIESYPAPYAGPWVWGYPGWWGHPYWGDEVDVQKYREGTLSIDVFDAHSHRAVWHGWAEKQLSQADIDRSERPIRTAVAAVLAGFPPK
jgi:Domain of unknown function (DUF4136)